MTTETTVLKGSAIVIGQFASDRTEAIARVGGVLVAEGLVTSGYVEAMQARERVISTYLGNGIALPHGTSDAQDTILGTGLAVVQYPAGVPWGDDEARLVIGLAARSDEHIAVLSRLAGILENAELCARLAATSDAGEILAALTSEAEPPAAPAPRVAPAAMVRSVRIANPHGLHARPAAQVVERAMAFDAEVTIACGDRSASALSITRVIALGANTGEEVTVSAVGPEAEPALAAVLEILLAADEVA
ncbi:MAG TPA: HPr family phosphocarrier protein [Candidatus Dormibacteraeota bacterium]|nr:HPr family phosphocarrier protein [Candidatus Dormibacteraeota bacterium]